MRKKMIDGRFSCDSNVGRVRLINEDAAKVIVNSNGNILMMVADGMGGHKKGEFASNETIKIIEEKFLNVKKFLNIYQAAAWLGRTMKVVNSAIYKKQTTNAEYAGMGTTLTLVLLFNSKMAVLNMGDSRAYIIKDNKLVQLTEDQTYVNYLLKCGEISRDQALIHPERHVLTNAVGMFPSVSYELKIYQYNNNKVLLCSDGLYNFVNFSDIENILLQKNGPEDKCTSLIGLANHNGGEDNITVAIWEPTND